MAAAELKRIYSKHTLKSEKILILLILLVLLTAAVAGMASVLASPGWSSLWTGLFFGLIIGWGLAIFGQPAWRSALIVSTLGLIYALVYASRVGREFIIALNEIILIIRRLGTNIQYQGSDIPLILEPLIGLTNTIGVILERVYTWVFAVVTGEPAFDPVAAVFVWLVLVWLVAAWAGWVAIRYRKALLAIMPAVLLSVGVLSFAQRASFSLYLMLGLTLILMAIVQQSKRQSLWVEVGTAFPPRKGNQIVYISILISIAAVLFSGLASSISIPRLLELVSTGDGSAAQGEGGLADSLGIVSGATPTEDIFEGVREPGLPRDKLIGSGPELSKQIVMTVALGDLPSIIEDIHTQPLYWRSFTYDSYTGRGWRTSKTISSQYDANQVLLADQEQYPQHVLIEQVVRPVDGESQIAYMAGEPVTINHSSEVARRSPGDLFGILIEDAHSIKSRSLLPVVDEQTLRKKGQNYPDWVKTRFLYLPPDIPSRVNELALQLTAPEPTPYDRVKAIERYLRTIPYTLDVPYPPLDKDLVDFFIFDLRQGYCDYYASAMVVMARAAGVPARFATGYASGTYDLNAKRFRVSEADAHSWVEIYFPDIGWVPFEPTAGRPSFDRSQQLTSDIDESLTLPVETSTITRSDFEIRGWLIWLVLFASIGMLGFAWVGFDVMRLHNLPERAAAKEVFLRLRRYGKYLEVTSVPGNTPNEFVLLLQSKLQRLMESGFSPAFKGNLAGDIDNLTDEIVKISYQPINPRDESGSSIVHQWLQLRWRLLLLWSVKFAISILDGLRGTAAGGPNEQNIEQGTKERL